MGLYITNEDVKNRLIGKVRFTTDYEDKNKMHETLLTQLVNEAEGEVEYDLSPRYQTPFVTINCGAFNTLPDRPTKNILKMLCKLKACVRVLETDFGAGTIVNGDAYADKLKDRYDNMIESIMKRKGNGQDNMTGWLYPPLPGLRLAYFNRHADDGYAGMVMNTSMGVGSYPARQINDPSQSWFYARFDEDFE